MNEKFIMDSNVFITPYRDYYNFTIAPGYWVKLGLHVDDFRIFTIDSVYNELCLESKKENKDRLQIWVEDNFKESNKEKVSEEVLQMYASILQYIEESDLYSDKALREWADFKVADPWIIAVAAINNYTVVTLEKFNHSLNTKNPSSNPKIPNICAEFGVKYVNLSEMLELLSIQLE